MTRGPHKGGKRHRSRPFSGRLTQFLKISHGYGINQEAVANDKSKVHCYWVGFENVYVPKNIALEIA